MAANTISRNRTVIHRCPCPANRAVTHIALLRGWDMGRTLARGNNAVMTTVTHAIDLCVIHRRNWRPGHARMTSLAHIAGIDMTGRFISGNHTIVAAGTNPQYLGMIHQRIDR